MAGKRLAMSAMGVALLLGSALQAQTPPPGPNPEQQQIMQQMRDLQMKIMSNMQKQGVDPREFFQGMMQQMQDGTFDANDFNQQLVDKGLIDQESLTKAQDSIKKLSLDSVKRQLGASDDEWTVILPKIEALVSAQNKLAANNPMSGRGGGLAAFMPTSGKNDLAVAVRELRIALNDKSTPDATIVEKLKAVRDARAQAKVDAETAKKDLADILTVRQEGVLVRLGLIQ